MKKQLFMLLAGALVLGAACTDLSELEGRVSALEERVNAVEIQANALNTNAAGLRASITALENNDYVTAVTKSGDQYTLTFAKSDPVVIKNGTDGTSPTIGFVEVGGVKVWSVNGTALKDGDKYFPIEAATPEFKFEVDTWYWRAGSTGTWTAVGSGGGSNCTLVDGTDTVTLTVGNTTVYLPKAPAPPVNLSAAGTANCYIVNAAGNYVISAVKGNSGDSVGEVASVAVLWETVNTTSGPAAGTIVCDPKVSDGKIGFTVPAPYTEGNALIAAKNAGGEILWSWHIWVTAAEIGQVTMANNAGIFMDRYVGALGNTPGDTRARGFFYQWGRKDPFMGVADKSGTTWVRYAATGVQETQKAAGAELTIAYTVANPTVWGLRDTSNNDWLTTGDATTDATRWAKDNNPKTIYDPCPAGWRVPGNGSWFKNAGLDGALTTGITFDAENEKTGGVTISSPYCTPDSYWPTTGQYANGGIRGVNNYFPNQYGGTWAACTVGMSGGSNNASRVLMFRNTDMKFFPNENTYKQFGQAVRCCKI